MRIRLRKVRPGDAGPLAQAWRDQAAAYADVAPDRFAVPDEDGLGAWLVDGLATQADPDRQLVLVADVDGDAVGFVTAAVVPPHPDADRQAQRDLAAPTVRLEALVVRRDWWRRGVGTRLVTAVEDWARNRGATAVTAQAFTAGPATAFLADRGYATRAVVHERRLDGED